MPSPSPPSICLPERYRVTRRIAAGGMAEVWAAHDEILDRPVAVKVLGSHLSADETARRRFMREARAAAGASSHPSVVTIFDVGQADERPFIVMELRDGGTLADAAGAGRAVEPARALPWLRCAGDALDFAHARGIVHRDIKPANLLLDSEGNLAVADFGIARLAWETTQVTATGEVLGTTGYLSPEQAAGAPASPASDRYALAVIAYELLAGGRLFPYAEHFTAQARAHLEDVPLPPSLRNPKLPLAVDGVLLRGLAKDPAQRWPSAKAMVAALATALGAPAPAERPWMTAATRVAVPPLEPTAALDADELPVVDPRQHGRRRQGSHLVVALAGAGVCAVVGALAAGAGGPGIQRAVQSRPSVARAAPRPPLPPGTPTELNNRGYVLFQQGRYKEALPLFQAAVRRCGGSRQLDPCGYALYNLGASLTRAGRAEEAVPILTRRLRMFGDNATRDVQRELTAAAGASRS